MLLPNDLVGCSSRKLGKFDQQLQQVFTTTDLSATNILWSHEASQRGLLCWARVQFKCVCMGSVNGYNLSVYAWVGVHK